MVFTPEDKIQNIHRIGDLFVEVSVKLIFLVDVSMIEDLFRSFFIYIHYTVRIGLRLGCNLCTPHICKCNAKVDEIGTHGLSCFKSSGRFSRHTEINSIINRSLTSIHVNSILEPNGLSRDDGKRPDGMTLVPWIKGQPLVWDVTVVDTLADSYVLKSSEVSGSAAEMACKRKT
jgi:hypothetical protein